MGGGAGVGHGGCHPRIEVIVKMQNKVGGMIDGVGWVDVDQELKL